MRQYLYILLMLFSIISGCSNENDDDFVSFNVVVKGIDHGQATLVITHNGSNRDSYCGFVTEGKVGDIQTAITKYLETAGSDIEFRKQKKKVVKVGGLASNTTYTYIVFGMTGDYKQYGQAASVTFTMGEGGWQALENPNWEMNYVGASLYASNYYSQISIQVKDLSEETYFVGDYDQSLVERYPSIEAFLSYAADDFSQRWKNEDKDAFWKEDFQLHSGSAEHYAHLSAGYTYVSYAIGLNSDGMPTGHYAKTEPYSIEEYPMLPTYANIFYKSKVSAKWELASEDGQTVLVCSLRENVRNESLTMTWDALTYSSLNKFVVRYSPLDGMLQINSGETRHSTTTRINGKIISGDMYIMGWYKNEQGDTILSSSKAITQGELQDDGTYRFTPSFTSRVAGMSYVMVKKDNTYVIIPDACISFPFVMRIPEK